MIFVAYCCHSVFDLMSEVRLCCPSLSVDVLTRYHSLCVDICELAGHACCFVLLSLQQKLML